jgi:predicted membrane protein DUF2306
VTQLDTPPTTTTGGAPVRTGPHWVVRWLRNPIVLALGALVVFNLLWALPRYIGLDTTRSRIPEDPTFIGKLHYEVLVAHIFTANLALVLLFFQVSIQLRRRFPAIHRASGRTYIFAGALPTSILALWLVPSGGQPFGKLGMVLMGALWIITTVMGYVRARQHRYVEHRNWMIYSIVLALATTWGRLIVYLMDVIPGFKVDFMLLIDISSWASWSVGLLVAHLWVQHTAAKAPELVR